MKRIKVIVSLFIVTFVGVLFLSNNFVKAESQELESIGTYTLSIPIDIPKKVYVSGDLVDYLKGDGVYVREEIETTGALWWKKTIVKYFYIANKYVNEIVYTRQIYNDVDSMIFMVKELENRVKEVNNGKVDKNIVMGYIRSINSAYVGGYSMAFDVIAGYVHEDKIKEINKKEKDKIGLKLHEYFAQFVTYKDDDGYSDGSYNSNLHGSISEIYRNNDTHPKKLIDPADNSKGIDLTHLFASMDGIYSNTEEGPFILFGTNKIERDIISWNGDLQQAVRKIYEYTNSQEPILDYSDLKLTENQKMKLLFNGDYGCSEDDILADIDSMNIIKLYVETDEMLISESLNAYYWILSRNPKFRYRTFIKTILIDEENKEAIENPTEIKRFELEVSSQFNVKKDGNDYCNHKYYDLNIYSNNTQFKFMLDDNNNLIDAEIRIFVVKSFVEYIEENIR